MFWNRASEHWKGTRTRVLSVNTVRDDIETVVPLVEAVVSLRCQLSVLLRVTIVCLHIISRRTSYQRHQDKDTAK